MPRMPFSVRDLVAHGREEAAFATLADSAACFASISSFSASLRAETSLAGPAITLEFTRAVEDRRAADAGTKDDPSRYVSGTEIPEGTCSAWVC